MLAYREVLIANGQSLSSEVDLREHRLVAIIIPAAWTAASLTFAACIRPPGATTAGLDETFVKVVDDGGNEVTITVAVSTYIVFDNDTMLNVQALGRAKVRSGTAASAVAQGADRTLVLVLEPRGE